MQKERYFTLENIQTKGKVLLAYVEAFHRRRVKSQIQPGKVALLVLDMQAYFLEPDSHAFVPSAPAIVRGISRLTSVFNERVLPVIYTRHINTAEDTGMMSVWWRETVTARSAYSHIVEQFETSKSLVLNKPQYDAFYNTALEETLRARGVEQVIIAGVSAWLR